MGSEAFRTTEGSDSVGAYTINVVLVANPERIHGFVFRGFVHYYCTVLWCDSERIRGVGYLHTAHHPMRELFET